MYDAHILIIDDEESIRKTFSAFLKKEGYTTAIASDYGSAIELLKEGPCDLVFTDILLGQHSGVDILKEIKAQGYLCPVIMITGAPDIETAAASVRLGAFDYLSKPINKETLVRVTKHALQHKALLDEKTIIEREKEQYQTHLEAIFRSVTDALITVDPDMRVIQANDALERICGISPGNLFGERIADIGSACCRQCWKVLEEAMETKRSIREFMIECAHPKRPKQVVIMNISPLKDSTDKDIGAVAVIRDVTRLYTLEKQLQDRHQFHHIIGRNKRMQEIFSLLDDLRDMDTTVLITGPSGTGKELIAQALHFNGSRSASPFVVVNCSALAENLLESELFGHVKGAFTGAIKDKTGRFQLANHGTIFLDEIGDISPRIQLKLLRVLETKEFERVGDSTPIKMDVQIITATNRDLRERVRAGEFREDLYYRLKVVEIKLAPRSQRRDDIPLLVNHYISVFNQRFNKHVMGVSTDVEKLFMEYAWPGNVRELVHVLEHAFVVSRKPAIEIKDLPPEIREVPLPGTAPARTAHSEKDEIIDALDQTGWNKAKAARLLGFSRQTIYRKVHEYHIRNSQDDV